MYEKNKEDNEWMKGFGGDSAVPRAVRHGVALCLAALRPDQADILRLGKCFIKFKLCEYSIFQTSSKDYESLYSFLCFETVRTLILY